METRTAEIIVKIVAVLAWIGALFSVIGALGLLALGSMSGAIAADPTGAGLLAGLGIAGAILMLVLAALYAFVGWGLWTYKNWARIVTVVLSVLGLVSALFSLAASPGVAIFMIIIDGLLIWLFGFEETVKSLFTVAPASSPARAAPARAPARKAAKNRGNKVSRSRKA